MKRNQLLLGILAAAAAALLGVQGAQAQVPGITWNTDNATALGTGCNSRGPNPDVRFITSGPDMSVLFSAFEVSLPGGGPDRRLGQMKNCNVRIPATLRRGFYLSTLTQALTYGVTKTANSAGTITTRSTFFNLPVEDLSVTFARVEANIPSAVERKRQDFLVNATCEGPDLSGLYQSAIAVSGVRGNDQETIIIGAQVLDLRYDVTVPVLTCPEAERRGLRGLAR